MEKAVRELAAVAKKIGKPKMKRAWAEKAGRELKKYAAKRVKEAGLEDLTLGDLLDIPKKK